MLSFVRVSMEQLVLVVCVQRKLRDWLRWMFLSVTCGVELTFQCLNPQHDVYLNSL